MADIAFTFDTVEQKFDWVGFDVLSKPANSDLDLETSVALSIFTDRVAPENYEGDPRGWWGDSYEDGLIGSRIWMLSRSTTVGALQRAKDYCNEALQWMLDDKIAGAIDVQTFWLNSDALGITINVIAPGKRTPREFNYSLYWKSIS